MTYGDIRGGYRTSVLLSLGIGGGAYWAGWATAAHFSVFVCKAYSLPAHFFVVENLIFS